MHLLPCSTINGIRGPPSVRDAIKLKQCTFQHASLVVQPGYFSNHLAALSFVNSKGKVSIA